MIAGCSSSRVGGHGLPCPRFRRERRRTVGAGWYPVIEITNLELLARIRAAVLEAWGNQSIKAPAPGQSTWDSTRDPPAGSTVVHKIERQDPREAAIGEWCERFEPDQEPSF